MKKQTMIQTIVTKSTFRLRTAAMLAGFALAVLTFTGCATSGNVQATRSLPSTAQVTSSDRVNVEVIAGPGVVIADNERSRFASQVESCIRAKAHPGNRGGQDFRIVLNVTRYEKGNAMARAMLAGLGQMHIDGTVAVHTPPTAASAGDFTIRKTFAWGGMVGASTTIETVEQEFGKAVAAAVCAGVRR